MDNYTATELAYKNGYKAGYEQGERDALFGLKEQDVTDINVGSKWISVTESLPEEGEKVLGYSSKSGNYCVGSYSKRWNKWRAAGSPMVTHWMPLPDQPKKVFT